MKRLSLTRPALPHHQPVLTTLWALTALLPIAGCGGGGSSNGGGGATSPATRLLTPQAGQAWTYRLSGTVTSNGISAAASGTLTESYTAPDPGTTGATFDLVTTGKLTAGLLSVPLDSVEAIQVDSAGNENVIGIQPGASAALALLKTPILLVPGTFSPSFNYSNSSSTADGATPFGVTFNVVGQATVTVPAGTFNTWKVTATVVQGTVTSTETEYFAPEIGDFVKSTAVANDSSTPKSSLSVSAELTSTTVSL